MMDDGGGRERNSCPLRKACLSPRGLQVGQHLVPAGGSTPSAVPAKGDITLLPLAWFNFIWGGGWSREFVSRHPTWVWRSGPSPAPTAPTLGSRGDEDSGDTETPECCSQAGHGEGQGRVQDSQRTVGWVSPRITRVPQPGPPA